jgi:hypothetical protein
MKRALLATLLPFCGAALCGAQEFERPVRLKVNGDAIRVERPGYAAPWWGDLNGKKTLLVGQFNQGKIQAFHDLGGCKLAQAGWIQAEGKAAEVPGVW